MFSTDVRGERLGQREGLAAEEHVLEAPRFRGQGGGIAHLALPGHQRQPHGAARRVAGRPGFSRSGIGSMAVGAQRPAVDEGVGKGVDDLIAGATEHGGGDGRGGDSHEQDVIQADAVETVVQRKDPLDFVGLDQRLQHGAHGQPGPAPGR